jgi:hypothetical protein
MHGWSARIQTALPSNEEVDSPPAIALVGRCDSSVMTRNSSITLGQRLSRFVNEWMSSDARKLGSRSVAVS